MNRDEARYILRAYRTSGEDASDPQFQEALQLVKQDPEHARSFAEEQYLDAQIANKLRVFPVPPQVRSQLLVVRKIIRPAPWWRKPARRSLTVAAVAVALLALTILWTPRRDNSAVAVDFRQAMAKVSLDMSSHVDVMGLPEADLHKWIVDRGGTADFDLPPGLRAVPISGCKIVDWHGHNVTLICFKSDGNHFDVFVLNGNDIPDKGLGSTAQFAAVEGVTTVTWRRGGKVYLLASTGPRAALEKLL